MLNVLLTSIRRPRSATTEWRNRVDFAVDLDVRRCESACASPFNSETAELLGMTLCVHWQREKGRPNNTKPLIERLLMAALEYPPHHRPTCSMAHRASLMRLGGHRWFPLVARTSAFGAHL